MDENEPGIVEETCDRCGYEGPMELIEDETGDGNARAECPHCRERNGRYLLAPSLFLVSLAAFDGADVDS